MIASLGSSIGRRLTAALGGAALLTLVIAAAGLAVFDAATVERRARQSIEPYVELVSVGTELAVAFEDPVRAQEVLATLRASPAILRSEIILADGRVLATYSRPKARDLGRAPLDGAAGLYVEGSRAELIHAFPEGARLRIVMSLRELNRQSRNLLLLLAAGILVLLAMMAVGAGAVLRRSIVGPITSLASTVEQLGSPADYRWRAPQAGADEVARLAQGFNTMLGTIQKREEQLQQLTLAQRAILDNAAYGIISVAPDGVVTTFNVAAERLLGYRAEEIVGKRTPMIWHDRDEIAARARALSEELGEEVAPDFAVFTARARRDLPEESEWTFIRKDQARVPVLVSITALRAPDRSITGFVGLTQDLTERKRAEAEIRAMTQALEQRVHERTAQLEDSNKELEAFCYSVSHDLRAPLRHIDGYVDLLTARCRAGLGERGTYYLETIAASAREMGDLIDNLLELSRTGRAQMRCAPVDMNQVVDEALASLGSASAAPIEWSIQKLPPTTGDFALLRQVWVNLLGNAVKYSSSRARPRIEVGSVETETETIFSVSDNGVGFDMRYATRLFGAFQRLHSDEAFEGTGIGLAIVERIVSRHGGRVWAEAEVDRGATFSFALPRRRSGTEHR